LTYVYGLLSLLGLVLPYSQFVPWLGQNGLNLSLLIQEATHTRISAFAWADVVVSVIVLIGFILYEGKRSGIKLLWIPIIGTLTVGVSFGLPLFLFLRELHIAKNSRK